jgi:hypothetical protein
MPQRDFSADLLNPVDGILKDRQNSHKSMITLLTSSFCLVGFAL